MAAQERVVGMRELPAQAADPVVPRDPADQLKKRQLTPERTSSSVRGRLRHVGVGSISRPP